MNFGEALENLKKGKKLYREGWNGKNMYIELQLPTELSKMTLPYIYLVLFLGASQETKALVPWLASQTDVLAEDWKIKE